MFFHLDYDNKNYWEFLWMVERLGKEMMKKEKETSGLDNILRG
jgi:hypothetical protein